MTRLLNADGAFVAAARGDVSRASFVSRVRQRASKVPDAVPFTARALSNYERGSSIAYGNAVALAAALDCCYLDVLQIIADDLCVHLASRGFGAPNAPLDQLFVRRPEEHRLVGELTRGRPVVLYGLPMSGRTRLAASVVPSLWHAFSRGVVWVNCRDDYPNPAELVRDVEGALGLGEPTPTHPGRAMAGRLHALDFARRLWRRDRVVLFDDVPDAEYPSPLFSAGTQVPVLMTTDRPEVAEALCARWGATSVEIGPLEPGLVLDYLQRATAGDARLAATEEPCVHDFISHVGGLPGRMTYAAAALRERKHSRLSSVASELADAAHLRQSVVRGLDVPTAHALACLGAFGRDVPFTAQWAAAAIDCDVEIVGDYLDAFGFRVREAGPDLFVVEPYVQAAVGALLGPHEQREWDRRLVSAAADIAADLLSVGPVVARDDLVASSPLWHSAISAAVRVAASCNDQACLLDIVRLARSLGAALGTELDVGVRRLLEVAINAAARLRDKPQEGMLALFLARWYARVLADFGASSEMYARAESAFRDVGDSGRLAEVLSDAGVARFASMQFREGAALIEKAVELTRRASSPPNVYARRLENLAFARKCVGRPWEEVAAPLAKAREVLADTSVGYSGARIRAEFNWELVRCPQGNPDVPALRQAALALWERIPADDLLRGYLLATAVQQKLQLRGEAESDARLLRAAWWAALDAKPPYVSLTIYRVGQVAYYLNNRERNEDGTGCVRDGVCVTEAWYGPRATVPSEIRPLLFFVSPLAKVFDDDYLRAAQAMIVRWGIAGMSRCLEELDLLARRAVSVGAGSETRP